MGEWGGRGEIRVEKGRRDAHKTETSPKVPSQTLPTFSHTYGSSTRVSQVTEVPVKWGVTPPPLTPLPPRQSGLCPAAEQGDASGPH